MNETNQPTSGACAAPPEEREARADDPLYPAPYLVVRGKYGVNSVVPAQRLVQALNASAGSDVIPQGFVYCLFGHRGNHLRRGEQEAAAMAAELFAAVREWASGPPRAVQPHERHLADVWARLRGKKYPAITWYDGSLFQGFNGTYRGDCAAKSPRGTIPPEAFQDPAQVPAGVPQLRDDWSLLRYLEGLKFDGAVPLKVTSFHTFERLFHASWAAANGCGLRYGQHAFNLLESISPEMAKGIKCSLVDPFNDDTRVDPFLAVLKWGWDSGKIKGWIPAQPVPPEVPYWTAWDQASAVGRVQDPGYQAARRGEGSKISTEEQPPAFKSDWVRFTPGSPEEEARQAKAALFAQASEEMEQEKQAIKAELSAEKERIKKLETELKYRIDRETELRAQSKADVEHARALGKKDLDEQKQVMDIEMVRRQSLAKVQSVAVDFVTDLYGPLKSDNAGVWHATYGVAVRFGGVLVENLGFRRARIR